VVIGDWGLGTGDWGIGDWGLVIGYLVIWLQLCH